MTSGGGNTVVIETRLAVNATFHGRAVDRVFSYYNHLNSIDAAMTVGATVTAGQAVGTMGQTGDMTFTHLHFETRLVGYCSKAFHVENSRTPSATSACDTGFDPHVHPFLFLGRANPSAQTAAGVATALTARRLTEIRPRSGAYAFAVRYNSTTLDWDRLVTDLGLLGVNLRDGFNTDVEAALDDVLQANSWVSVVPGDYRSATGYAIAYDFHFVRRPRYVGVYDVFGQGLVWDPESAAPATLPVAGTPGATPSSASLHGSAVVAAVVALATLLP